MVPVMPEKQHALLMLQYENGERNGYIQVTATDPRPGYEVNTPEKEQEELERWAQNQTAFGGPLQFPVPSFHAAFRAFLFFHPARGAELCRPILGGHQQLHGQGDDPHQR